MHVEPSRGGGGRVELGIVGVVEVNHLDWMEYVEESKKRWCCERRVNGVGWWGKSAPSNSAWLKYTPTVGGGQGMLCSSEVLWPWKVATVT